MTIRQTYTIDNKTGSIEVNLDSVTTTKTVYLEEHWINKALALFVAILWVWGMISPESRSFAWAFPAGYAAGQAILVLLNRAHQVEVSND